MLLNKKEITQNNKFFYLIAGFFLLFIGPLLKYPPAYDYVVIKNIPGFLFCLFLSVFFILEKKTFTFNKNIFIPFLIFAGWILFSAFTSPIKHGAAKQLEEYLLYFLIFVLAMNIEFEKKWLYFWISSGYIISIIGIFQYFSYLKYPVSMFGNPNFFAGHIMMLIPITFSVLFAEKIENKDRVFLSVFFILSIIALSLTKSRSAIFATFFGLSTVIFLVNWKTPSFFKKWGGYIILFIVTLFILPIIYKWFSSNIRIYLWKGTFEMIKKKPVIGWGLGNFVFFYPYFRIKEYFLQAESTPVTTHAHNEYLHLWSEIGIIGLIFFLLIIISLVFLLRKRIRKNTLENILFLGVIGGIFAVLIDNIFSTNLRNPSTAMYFWFLIGISAGKLKKEVTNIDISKVLWYTIATVSFLMSIFTSFYRILPEVYLKRGIWAKERGEMRESIDNYLIVSSLNPYNYVSRYKLAYVYGETGYLEEAKKVYQEINNKIFPHFAKLDSNLGTILIRQGLYKEALYHYKWEVWFNPYSVDAHCSIASIFFIYYNDIQQGVDSLTKVLKIDPNNEYSNRIIKMLKEEGKI